MYKVCKTEDSAARQRQMEEALLLALARQPYDKITIRSICESLPIPRKTFYRYFSAKEDLLLSLIDHRLSDCNGVVFSDWEGNRQFDKATLERFFSFWQEEKPFLDAIVGNHFWPLLLERTTQIVDTMKETATEPKTDSFAREQIEYFISHGLMSSILRWHHFGYPCSSRDMAEEFSAVLCSPNLSISRLFL